MKNCVKCNALIDGNAAVCPVCGAPQPTVRTAVDDQVLSTMERFLRYERTAWKVGGIVLLVFGILFAVLGIVMFVMGIVYGGMAKTDLQAPIAFGSIFAGSMYFTMALTVFIPEAVINLIMVNKVKYYLDTMYTDVSIARKRCTSVGMIIFGALFNTVAMAFIIVNFVKTRTRSAAFDRIEARQKS